MDETLTLTKPKGRGGAGRGQGRKPISDEWVRFEARLTPMQSERLKALGGPAWLRAQLDAASNQSTGAVQARSPASNCRS